MKKAIRSIADTEAFALVTHRLEDSSNTHASNTSWDEVSRKEEFISPLRFTFVRAKPLLSNCIVVLAASAALYPISQFH